MPEQFDLSAEETWSTPRTTPECSREIFPQTEELCDVTDTYPQMELDVEKSSEQPTPSVPNTNYVKTRNLDAMTNTDIIS